MLVVLFFLFHYISRQPERAGDEVPTLQISDFIQLLISLAFWFLLSMFLLATISVLFSFLVFQFGKKNKYADLLHAGSKNVKSGYLQGNIPFYIKPLLGKLQAMVWYKDDTQQASFFSKLPIGKFLMELPVVHIKVYNVQEIELLFLDFLRMYRLPATVYGVGTFLKHPKEIPLEEVFTQPKIYSEENETSSQILPNPEEWLQFKHFESGDDVRRILWKLYAKNKDLFVRHQEPYTQYSSKLSLLVFFELDPHFSRKLNMEMQQHLLNFYKQAVYTIYLELSKNFKEVAMAIHSGGKAATEADVLNLLTAVSWQSSEQQIEIPEKTFIIAPSLCPQELWEVLNQLKAKDIALIPLLKDLKINPSDQWWLKWLFKNRIERTAAIQHELPRPKVLQFLQVEENNRLAQL